MPHPSERTRLLPEANRPQYLFDINTNRRQKNRVRQFQCCVCIILLCILIIVLITTVIYSINNSVVSDNSSSIIKNDESAEVTPVLIFLSNSWPISDEESNIQNLSDEAKWREAINVGKEALKTKNEMEKNVPSLPLRSPSYRHQKVIATSETARNLSQVGYIVEYATQYMNKNSTNNTVARKICHKGNNTSLLPLLEFCQNKETNCNIFHKYRTYDGSCNNLKHPQLYGVAYRPFRRVLSPDYADGISKPRISKSGADLPSARTVSLIVHRARYKSDPKFSVMLAVWGQFIDHDITATAISQKSNGSTISCCDTTSVTSPECFPVLLEAQDPLQLDNITCVEFVRSAPAPSCCMGSREQINQVTSFIDGSVIYSAEEKFVKSLRNFQNGTLKMYVTEDNRMLLPLSEDPNDGCNREEETRNGRYCFLAGDNRVNENLHLTSMQVIWARHHNLLAQILSQLNPHWDDEIIFQEVRKIIGAQMQHITYTEFLPILFGKSLMNKFHLTPQKKGYFEKYNDSVDASIANSFATAAFRFAHSIIPGMMKFLAKDTSSPEYVEMRKMLFDPFKLYHPGQLDRTLRGVLNTTIEANDPYFNNELKSHLFERSKEQAEYPKFHGLDLVALNIQRGRDHGLPGYVFWRSHCGLSKPTKFTQLESIIDKESLKNIKSIYRYVEDIDLYTGALSEKPLNDGILGPTLTCLILDQFIRIKHGDRFWYENPKNPQAFNLEQLNEIRKSSLAKVICDNSDDLDIIQPKVMEQISSDNDYIPCSKINGPDLSHWKENLYHLTMTNDYIKVLTVAGGVN